MPVLLDVVAFETRRGAAEDQHGIEVELVPEGPHPLLGEMRRTEDREPLDFPAIEQLTGNQARLDGLADPHVVGDQDAHRVEAERHEQRNELVGTGLHAEVRQGPEGPRSRAEPKADCVAQGASGQVIAEREPREAVSRQEPLPCKVPVDVEVRVGSKVDLGEQAKLYFRLVAQPLGNVPIAHLARRVQGDGVLPLLLRVRRSIEAPLAFARRLEAIGDLAERLGEPRVVVRAASITGVEAERTSGHLVALLFVERLLLGHQPPNLEQRKQVDEHLLQVVDLAD